MLVVVNELGAVGDGRTLCTQALQRAIDTAAGAGGGMVHFPSGTYVTGTLWLRSNVTLMLEAGATILGAEDVEAFPQWTPKWEGPGSTTRAALICGEGLENIAIIGKGTIDGRGQMWWKLQRQLEKSARIMRPRLIRLVDCRNVLIEDVTLTNSPAWTLNPVACDTVNIVRVTVRNPPDSPNTDGINPDSCRNVHISDCHIDVGDDCITIKSGSEEEPRRQYIPCENITITNCTMIHGHGGVVIGSEMTGGVRNVVISNCTFVGTDRGIRIKSRRGRGGSTGAAVEDIRVSNIVMDGVLCPLAINLFYGCGAWGQSKVTDKSPQPVTQATPRFRRLRFSNISARNAKYSAAWVLGLPEMWVEDISYDNISIWCDPTNTQAGDSDMAPDIEKLCRAGMWFRFVRKLTLRNIDISDQLGSAIRINQCADVTISQATSGTPQADAPMIALQDVNDAYIQGCKAPRGQSVFLGISGRATRDIVVGMNHTRQAEQALSVAGDVPPGAVQDESALPAART
ncbi:MAG TPA: glycoside hydrolase family 28 protein [Tepidisphaeraceae bacterium]|nr:glycoside hydrolase family 28 protein [Tepidisphaeraceae bacterium]